MRKMSTLFLCLVLVFLSACGSGSENGNSTADTQSNKSDSAEKPDPYGRYAEPVTLDIGYYVPGKLQFPEGSGDTINDNGYTRMFEDLLNIKFTHAFEVPNSGYEEKVNLLIASNDIPDFMFVNEKQFKLLAESDMLEDLTQYYEDYASPRLKNLQEDFDSSLLKRASYDGKLLGIPATSPSHGQDGVVWIRKDWLKNVGIELQEAITLSDLEKVAKAFIENDPDQNGKKDTFGIQSTSGFVTPTVGYNTLDLVFTAYKSFPKIWVKNVDGKKIVYGSTLPETKQALAHLRDWYAAGLIDREFGTIKPDQFAKDLSAGKAGISMGFTWAPGSALQGSIVNDPSADWDAFALTAEDGKVYSRQQNPLGDIMVVKRGAKHPEAIIKAINIIADMESDEKDPDTLARFAEKTWVTEQNSTTWDIRPIQRIFRPKNSALYRFQLFQDAAAGKAKLEDMGEWERGVVETYLKGLENLKTTDPDGWSYSMYQFVGGAVVLNPRNQEVYSEYYGVTKTMETKWANLNKLEDEAFIRIITGDQPLDYFDTFVSEWYKQGGEEITQEVEAELEG